MPPFEFPKRIKGDAQWQAHMLLEKVVPAVGGVRLTIAVGMGGAVLEVLSVDGPEPLTAPAIDAVKQWKFRPTLLNGRPVEVVTNVEL